MKRVFACSALLLAACATTSAPPAASPGPSLGTTTSTAVQDEVVPKARAINDRAREAEPKVTGLLVGLAKKMGGSMYKLEYRLKTFKSTVRKLRLKLHAGPGVALENLVIEDSLRYTMQFDDEPDGHYVASVQRVLHALENEGHSVDRIKNYWPADDNYSGLNCVLVTKDGLPWELQFHTTQSLQVQKKTRPLYEELRLMKTSLKRKRELFDMMTAAWNEVEIPFEVLLEKNLHATEQIRNRSRP